jgi:hypothetical protein
MRWTFLHPPTRKHYLRIKCSIEIMVTRLERFDNTLYSPKKIPCKLPRKYKDRPSTLEKKYRKKHIIITKKQTTHHRVLPRCPHPHQLPQDQPERCQGKLFFFLGHSVEDDVVVCVDGHVESSTSTSCSRSSSLMRNCCRT